MILCEAVGQTDPKGHNGFPKTIRLFPNCFQQGVAGIGEKLNVDLGGHFIGEFEKLSTAADWH